MALVALLGTAMVTATYMQGALSVVASDIIGEFGITRSQLGAAFTVFSLTGAVFSPVMGSLTDRHSRRVMTGLFALSWLSVLMVAFAPGFAFLITGTVVGGIALAAGNPVTNRVIADEISVARRGLVVGFKQSGPPLGLLVAGALLPPLALAVGWRWAMAASAVIPAAGMLASPFLLRPAAPRTSGTAATVGDAPRTPIVFWLAVIGMGTAVALSAVIAFEPLYAQERVGASAATAGALAAALGLTGMVARIVWGGLAGRLARPSTGLLSITVISMAAVAAVAGAQSTGLWLLWLGTIGTGLSLMAWHAVGWLMLIDSAGTGGVGKASGVMQVGNSIGFALGPLLAGVLVDTTDSYLVAWGAVLAVLATNLTLTVWIRSRSGRSPRSGRDAGTA